MVLLRRRAAAAVLRSWGEAFPGIRCVSSFPGQAGGSKNDDEASTSGDKIDFGFREVPLDEKQTLVRQVFSSVASSYDVMNDLMSAGLHRVWKDRFVELLAPFPGQRHLDVAGGTGDVAFRVYKAIRNAEKLRDAAQLLSAAKLSNNSGGTTTATAAAQHSNSSSSSDTPKQQNLGSVVVCDINTAMLAEGERKAASQGIGMTEMRWVEGNAESLPFDDNSFDSYTVAFGIRNVTDRPAALAEARRVLRPGGRFLCLEFSHLALPIPGAQQIYDWYSFNIIPEIGRVVAGDADSYRYLVESIRMFPSQEDFAGMIREAGFRNVGYENLTGGVVSIHSGLNMKQ